ncbi:hypothetical protein HDV01_005194 [Terramyces sp. JEL0728]|nr:hypothetical protein HDV01_005194 [Terramyces sp. JEL0728]
MQWKSNRFRALNELIVKCIQNNDLQNKQLQELNPQDLQFEKPKPFQKVILEGVEVKVSDQYLQGIQCAYLGVTRVSKMIGNDEISELYNYSLADNSFGNVSPTEICILINYMEREALLVIIENLVSFQFNFKPPVINLLKTLLENQQKLTELKLNKNESTNQKRDELFKLGITEREILLLEQRLKRESNLIKILLIKIKKFGFDEDEISFILEKITDEFCFILVCNLQIAKFKQRITKQPLLLALAMSSEDSDSKKLSNIDFNCFQIYLQEKEEELEKELLENYKLILSEFIISFVYTYKKSFRQIIARDQDLSNTDAPETQWEQLLTLISNIYRDRPDSAIQWWTEPDLFQFVKLAADVWTPRFLVLFLKTISSLSSGQVCSNNVHQILNLDNNGQFGNITWGNFFRTLNSYLERLGQNGNMELSPTETSIILVFLDLVGNVVKHSTSCRRILCENQNYRALETLFFLLIKRLPIDLKAALLNTISCFCDPTLEWSENSNQVWYLLETSQIIPQRDQQGLLYDIKEIETIQQTYPETLAFLNLICNLVQCKSTSMYETLGEPDRLPGIRPYIAFIIDEIFLKIDERPFADGKEKWKICTKCLEIFNHCLEQFEMEPVLGYITNPIQDVGNNLSPLRILGLSPGFEIITRVLSGSKLALKIFQIIENESNFLLVKDAIFQSLKIIYFMFNTHKTFLEVVCPAIVGHQEAFILGLPISMSGIDTLLASHTETITKVTSFVNSDNEILCLIAMSIINLLSQSPLFSGVDSYDSHTNRLVGIIQASKYSDQILQGFIDRLTVDGIENNEQENFQQPTASGYHFDLLAFKHSYNHSIKLVILDLLIWNVSIQTCPNIAHFLLGLKSKAKEIEARSKENTCLAVIVNMLTREDSDSIYITHPQLAEKCLHLVYLVSFDQKTSTQALRFLRNECDFFAKQISLFKTVDDSDSVEHIDVQVSRLHQCAWLLQILALELHITALSEQRATSQRIIGLLFNMSSVNGMLWDSEDYQGEYEQINTKIVSILDSLNFRGTQMPITDLTQTVFNDFALADFMKSDEHGAEIFNVPAIYFAFLMRIDFMEKAGSIIQAGGRLAAQDQASELLNIIIEKNNLQKLNYARFHVAEAWCKLIRISMKSYSDIFPAELLERRIFEILTKLFKKVNHDSSTLCVGAGPSQVAVSLISQLLSDKKSRLVVGFKDNIAMASLDSFHSDILKGILACITNESSSTAVRGNYYIALIRLITYIKPDTAPSNPNQSRNVDDALYQAAAFIFKESSNFWEQICRDASDSEYIWQTVAFTALTELCALGNWYYTASFHSPHPMLSFLGHRNFLGHYIQTIKQIDDKNLCGVIMNTRSDNDVNRYVFETKMSFLKRFAETKTGAEGLLEHKLLETLTECRFLDQIPKYDISKGSMFEDNTVILYNGIIKHTLELIAITLSHFSSENVTVVKKAISFLLAHHGSILSLIKNSCEFLTLSSMKHLKLITGIFAWIGHQLNFVHIPFPGPGLNTFDAILTHVLEIFSGTKWHNKIEPSEEVERVKDHIYLPFFVAGTKRTVFAEEVLHLSEQISRNVLLFLQVKPVPQTLKIQTKGINAFTIEPILQSLVYTLLLNYSVDQILHLANELKNIENKIAELDQVPIEEINEVSRIENEKLSAEASLAARQEMYRIKISESVGYIKDKIGLLFSTLTINADIVEMSSIQLLKSIRKGMAVQETVQTIGSIEKLQTMNMV